ncbi:MAG TPA: type IV pilus assembly protein PilM [Candidatus Saccharimonadales bacterium]|nr:type IV pilus assembly protein PilM [Candidatus Saccharimonadales bacterium]
MSKNKTYFYKDKPIFGLDIGLSSIKVMQLETSSKKARLLGYGIGGFDPKAIKDGVIIDHELLAKAVRNLFEKNIVGEITTRRVAMSVPAILTYMHTINFPPIKESELKEAVDLESEQYIPLPQQDLYTDYEIIEKNSDKLEILTVAVPRKIIDSYMALVEILGLEAVSFDTSISSSGRLFKTFESSSDIPSVLIDFGSISADITIFAKTNIVSGTIPAGGDTFTNLLAQKLGLSREEAHVIKTKYGISKSKRQEEIVKIMQPELDQLVREVKRMMRYYSERTQSKGNIGQVITMGGGANMPGLSDYLTNALRLPVRTYDPWSSFDLHHIKEPSQNEKSVYATVAGLCLINPKEITA